MREKAIITPNILRWARETSKMSIVDVALKIKVKGDKIALWESGDDFLSINQLEKLSKLYRRPIAIFYLPEPPTDFQTLRDFRKNIISKEYSTALTFIIRDIQSKQSWFSDFLKEEGENKLDFIGKFNLKTSVEKIASDIIKTLEIETIERNQDILKYWIDKIEQKRIFVSLSSNIHSHLKIDINEVKGFAVNDNYAPFIFVNSADGKNSQLFTLIHELTHLWINASGVSSFNLIDFRNSEDLNKFDPIEVLCNRVTAEILMPKSFLVNVLRDYKTITSSVVEKIAEEMKVSSFALAVRMFNLNIISEVQFNQFRKVSKKKYEEYIEIQANKPKQKGGPSYYILKIRKNSKAFTSYIYGYYKSGRITGYEANKLLDIKVSNFKKLEKHLYA
ncbi:MAG: ImmA/IrrE family metallo-endopeptidase [Prolixibacteraceae bacterium]|jgi:Zn-dependent peptidase ImmA (M78 family)|nr:ImmA/IrrE family metallo-endopeptidase [Prolixibacteraceae bacterium]MBT6007607.1 ImmA/IrrE family metallo-endopeptidase [Prolixibacteraceae bacterium]MBT6767244.1 ImmA/IrrE family metallo-endopeptidase [Prolixibacteraceae bacterium]MBT6999620.1 ImmA/IrrE family metallo-endopeptidase [Prolixibacteraceae bacterium]MBT7393444.1 ImmA/IrrE family metallo-endopeptidase [Prolixibacteraceae bacterium]